MTVGKDFALLYSFIIVSLVYFSPSTPTRPSLHYLIPFDDQRMFLVLNDILHVHRMLSVTPVPKHQIMET